jgi:hypothetical protein
MAPTHRVRHCGQSVTSDVVEERVEGPVAIVKVLENTKVDFRFLFDI